MKSADKISVFRLMKLTDDLKSPRLIHAKGWLFLLLGLLGPVTLKAVASIPAN